MPNKPSVVPTWATRTTTPPNKLPPPTNKILDGWAAAEKPPFEYFNWWMNLVGNWLTYVNQLSASDLSVSFGGATTTVQAAIAELETRSGQLRADITDLEATTGRMFSGPSGGIVINGWAWPNASALDYTIGTPTVPAIQVLTPYSGSNTGGYTHAGLEFRNLTINGALMVEGIRSMFVLRVHGNLTLNGGLLFSADKSRPASGLYMQNVRSYSSGNGSDFTYYGNDVNNFTGGRHGGSGVVGAGGYWEIRGGNYLGRYTTGPSDPTQGAVRGGGLFQGDPSIPNYTALADYCSQAGLSGEPMAAAAWLQGGGMAGGWSVDSNGTMRQAEGGGNALVLVSGDIVIGQTVDCGIFSQGRQGGWRTPSNNVPLSVGGGGGGGGALFVYCGGQIRYPTGTFKPFNASGGIGGTGTSLGGSGGGGGLVFLCARNADASVHGRADGGTAGWPSISGGSGSSGSPGRVVAIKAIPSLLL